MIVQFTRLLYNLHMLAAVTGAVVVVEVITVVVAAAVVVAFHSEFVVLSNSDWCLLAAKVNKPLNPKITANTM